ncbi:MAG TPA: tetratricopeptide repeat protein, partial [Pseudomonadota bacterium]|nr:tetratricopeptide repeat protein [Pseudomonadota bacterium]
TVGLCEDLGYGHLRLDPGLPPYLLRQISAEQADALRARFAAVMAAYTGFLYQQLFKDARLASQLTRHELANLLAMLTWYSQHATAEQVVNLTDSVERLVADLGLPQALKRASAVREHAHQQLGAGWSRSKYFSESAAVDRLREAGDVRTALAAAQRILTKCQAVAAYPEAAYDLAMAFLRLGRVLQGGHQPEAAFEHIQEARTRFQALAAQGSSSAEGMASICLTESGNCLRSLGRHDAAADAYQQAIRQAEDQGRLRDVAVGKNQLGTVRLKQKRYPEALALYQEVREIFGLLGEPRSVAVVWHQIAMCHEEADDPARAESAYRESLAINVCEGHLVGQAGSLGQLGNLYDRLNRLEEAVPLYLQAAAIRLRFGDLGGEGRSQSNLANTLIKLKRYSEARHALLRALECDKSCGHAAEPWKTWALLSELEAATQQPEAARAARAKAEAAYLRYRQDGGDSQSNRIDWFSATLQALQHGATAQAVAQLEALCEPNDPPFIRALITALLAILHGDRRPQLADDPDLFFMDAVELRLLLAALAEGEAR